MKPNIKQISLFAIASSAFATAGASAQVTPGGTSQTLTVQIALHRTMPGTYEKDPDGGKTNTPKEPAYVNSYDNTADTIHTDEFASKIVTEKVGNKQILEALLPDGVPIAGWSIQQIEPFDGDSEFFLVKKGDPLSPIYIGDSLAIDYGHYAESGKYTFVENDTKKTETETGSSNWLEVVNISWNMESGDEFNFDLNGLGQGSDKLKKIGDSYEWIHNSETIKVIGNLYDPSEDLDLDTYDGEDDIDEGEAVAEGTLKLSAATVLSDISAYLDKLPD